MFKHLKYAFITTVFLLFFSNAFAASSPLPMLQSTTDQVIAALQQNKASLKTNPQVVYSIITRYLLPHVDVNVMSRLVLGKNWESATPTQRQQFTKQFTELLIHTYSSAFAAYNNQTVKFLPIRGGVSGSRAQVNSLILQRDGPSISVSYRLVQVGGEWKLYDFSIDGVSMIQSFRTQFSQQLNQGGIDSLIQRLAQHNDGPTRARR